MKPSAECAAEPGAHDEEWPGESLSHGIRTGADERKASSSDCILTASGRAPSRIPDRLS